jgi:hypothetical protein
MNSKRVRLKTQVQFIDDKILWLHVAILSMAAGYLCYLAGLGPSIPVAPGTFVNFATA